MEIFGVGPAELLLIAVIALIVFGPGKLPEIGAALGKAVGDFRRATRDLTSDLQESIDEVKDTVGGAVNDTQAELKDAANTVQGEAASLSRELNTQALTVSREISAQPATPTAKALPAGNPAPAPETAEEDADAQWLRLGTAADDDGATG